MYEGENESGKEEEKGGGDGISVCRAVADWVCGADGVPAFLFPLPFFYQRNNHVHKHAVAGDFVLQNDIGGSGVLGECQQHTEICPPQRAA